MTKYYITRITIDVLSKFPYDADSLDSLCYDITLGDCVGNIEGQRSIELTGKEMADRLYEFGSEPAFFQLDDNGISLDD